jgi:hypothetical protein
MYLSENAENHLRHWLLFLLFNLSIGLFSDPHILILAIYRIQTIAGNGHSYCSRRSYFRLLEHSVDRPIDKECAKD